jgi:hypothetical protein
VTRNGVGALEGLVVRVERAVVALEVFLATEATVAQSVHEGLARVLGERPRAAARAGVVLMSIQFIGVFGHQPWQRLATLLENLGDVILLLEEDLGRPSKLMKA